MGWRWSYALSLFRERRHQPRGCELHLVTRLFACCRRVGCLPTCRALRECHPRSSLLRAAVSSCEITFRVVCGLIGLRFGCPYAGIYVETSDVRTQRVATTVPRRAFMQSLLFPLICISCRFVVEVNRPRLQAGQPSTTIATGVPCGFVEEVANRGWPGQVRDRSRGQLKERGGRRGLRCRRCPAR